MTNLEILLLAMLGNKGGGGEGGTTNYNELDNRPQVNGITLTGNKDSEDLNLVDVDMIGVSYGVAALDGEGKVPESQLPPYPNYDTEIQNINKALENKAEQGSVSALEEKVEKKQNKTFIDSVDSETSVVTVPENVAGFAAISKISGKTIKDGEVLKSAPVKSVVSSDVDGNKTTVSLSDIVKDLPDYGIEGNILDLENMKYYHNFVSANVSDLTWNVAITSTSGKARMSTSMSGIIKPVENASSLANIICGKYETKSANANYTCQTSIAVGGTNVFIYDEAYATKTATEFKNDMNGVEFIYELATPEVIDLTSILYPFAVESGGTIEFINEHNLDVNNTVLYKKEVL